MSVSRDPFEKFAIYYDLMTGSHLWRREFFKNLIEKYRFSEVLDCACGTGSDLIALRSLGLDVTGSDISKAMLNMARKKLVSKKVDISLRLLDFRSLHRKFSGRFDAVFCLATSLPQLPDEKQVSRALRSMKQVLKKKGCLILSQGMTDRQYRLRSRIFPLVNEPDFSRLMVIDYGQSRWQVQIIDLIHTRSKSDSRIFKIDYLKILKDDYIRLLRQTGFTEIRFYGSHKLDRYSKEKSDILIVIARK